MAMPDTAKRARAGLAMLKTAQNAYLSDFTEIERLSILLPPHRARQQAAERRRGAGDLSAQMFGG